MDFNAANFVSNLKYMGWGMLAILVVMGVIMGSIYLLNAVFSREKKKKDN